MNEHVRTGSHNIWLEVERVAQNTVVQVYSQVGEFNWLEPYRIEEQYENRGTGFFINDQGFIVTNAHVIAEAKTVWVQMPALGRTILHAGVVGFCPERDLALLRITEEGFNLIHQALGTLPYLFFGDSDEGKRTDSVMVLGYPLGHHRLKSTIGVISGRESIGGISLLQMTAPINPGNSGGPLLTPEGKVVGIAVAATALAQNVGYAIPINELKIIFDDFVKMPFLRKPMLGAMFHMSTNVQAKFLGNPLPAGAYIQKIFKYSLLEKAGVLPGDMLYHFNGYQIDAFGEAQVPWSADRVLLRDLISRLSIGDEVTMIVYRQGEKKEFKFTFEKTPLYPVRSMYPGYDPVDYEVVGGMVIMQLSDNHFPLLIEKNPFLMEFQKIEKKTDPILVITHILPGSLAQQLRCLYVGGTIKSVNGIPVNTLADFRETLHKSLETDFLSVVTHDDVLAVFPFRAMLSDEIRLARDFVYPLSPIVKNLLEMA